MAFGLGAGLLLLVIIGLLSWYAWRGPGKASRSMGLHGRLEQELRDDVDAGVLPAEDYESASRDLEPEAAEAPAPQSRPRGKRGFRWAVVLALFVVVGSAGLYAFTGDWRAAFEGDKVAVMYRAHSMLRKLQDYLTKHPGDMNAWITMGQAKMAMGDYGAAAKDYGRAVKLDNEKDPDLMGVWGEALVLSNPHQLTDKEHAIFSAVLKIDPNNVRGLWYGGLIALVNGHRETAVTDWRRLLGQRIPAPMHRLIQSRLQAIGAATSALPAVATATASTARPVAGVAGKGPSIQVRVKLAPELATHVHAGETLFVLARSPQGGPPLAVRRISPRGFPVKVVLSNGNAMIPGHDLSNAHGPIEFEARLSPTGNATDTHGVYVGSQIVKSIGKTHSLTLVINHPAKAR